MKTFKLILLATAALFITNCVQAQTADDIINKYLNAIGGKEAIGKIKSLYMEFRESPAKGSIASSGNVNMIVGKGWRIEDNTGGKKIILCVTDSDGWMGSSIQGNAAQTIRTQALSNENYDYNKSKLEIDVPFGMPGAPFLDYAKNGFKVELIGKEALDSISVYNLKLTDKAGNETDFYIDANTFYLIKSVLHLSGSSVEMTTAYSAYRKTDIGYMMPFVRTMSMPVLDSGGVITTVTKMIINPEIDPKIFEQPE